MGAFVDTTPVPVSLDGPEVPAAQRNVIYIRPKMGVGVTNRVQSAAPDGLTAVLKALAVENITGWAGRDFAGQACTPAAILARVAARDPLMEQVLEEIAQRNRRPRPVAPAEQERDSS